MRPSNCARNPFITLITMISVATPSAIPTSEKSGDDGDEALRPLGAQVAAGDQPFEA